MSSSESKPERYSPEWNAALQRFLDAGQRLLANNNDREALAEFSEFGKKIGWIVPIEKQQPNRLPRPDKEEDQALLDDILPVVKAGDTLILPPDRRVKIVNVSEGMVWVAGLKPIPVGDVEPSGEPDTWVYKGDTLAGGFSVTSVVS